MKAWLKIATVMLILGLGIITGGALRASSGQASPVPTGAAETPQVINAKIETRAVNGSLAETLRGIESQANESEWVGYAVPEIAGDRTVCCGNFNASYGGCGTCRLEKENGMTSTTSQKGGETGIVQLEGSRQLVVLFRVEGKQVMRIREASENCTLDAGGLLFIWLTGVKPTESVALLRDFVHKATFEGHGEHEIGQGALSAIALHADASADRAFVSFVAADQPEQLREHASFWLGASRGKSGEQMLQKMAKSDPSPAVRSQVAFALSVSHEPEALNEMIRMAKDDESTHVRGQALFWLAQKAGQRAMGAITGAIENDPDTEVKKKAVFALSQMPKDEGVPKLIEVAKTNRNPEVRKQAMFWLGQSNDPRALDFFEQVLSR